MSIAAQLWQANQDLAEACLNHPFVQGIGDGSLPKANFAYYVGQDAFFLEAFARAYSIAAAKATEALCADARQNVLDVLVFLEHLLDALNHLLGLCQARAGWQFDRGAHLAAAGRRRPSDHAPLALPARRRDVRRLCDAQRGRSQQRQALGQCRLLGADGAEPAWRRPDR